MKFYKLDLVKEKKGEGYIIKGIVTHYWLCLLKTNIEVVELDKSYKSKYCKGYHVANKQKPISFNEAVLITNK